MNDTRPIPNQDEQIDQPLSPKILALVDRLPEHGWCITRAALAVGYSPSYVNSRLIPRLKGDARFCRAVELKRRETQQKSWDIEQWREMMAEAIRECDVAKDRTNKKELLRMIGQHIGAFEADNRQKRPQIGMVIM